MGYLVLARKWRPQNFEDLIGQDSIIRILQNAVKQSKIAHAYVFSGPRGVGKTSAARILSKALNCKEGPTATPCGHCNSCVSITEGSSVDVIEIDGASNNSVDDIRDLREKVKYAPSGGSYKVYIIDEAHMLSQAAFNALLKTLEEPPSHIVFVLATTAPNKIPITVLSRCQHLPFKRISSSLIQERLGNITGEENITITEKALELLARAADGSMRDALTLLDQVSAFSDEINEEDIRTLLGISDISQILAVVKALLTGNRGDILRLSEEVYEKGLDIREFTRTLISFLRDLLVCKISGKVADVFETGEESKGEFQEVLSLSSEEHLTLLLDTLVSSENHIRISGYPRVALEMALIKASFLSSFRDIGEIIKKLSVISTPVNDKNTHEEAAAPDIPPADTLSESCKISPEVTEGNDLWANIVKKVDEKNHVLACKLSHAEAEFRNDTLSIEFNGGFSVHADSVKKYKRLLEDTATQITARKIKVSVGTKKNTTGHSESLEETVLNDPFVKKTLELFDGRIVDIRHKKTKRKKS